MSHSLKPLSKGIHYLRSHKTKSAFFVIGVFLVLIYGLAFFIPKNVQLSYAGPTCARQLTIAPSLHQSTGEDYEVTFQNEKKLGSWTVISFKTCFRPSNSIEPGTKSVVTSPFGGWIARKHFAVNTASAPVANVSVLDKPVPISKPLLIPVSSQDDLHDYRFKVGSKVATCASKENQISCDIVKLKLDQGKQYDSKLIREYKSSQTELAKTKITTLKAIKVTKSSVKNQQIIYAKPRTFTFETDKQLNSAEVTLESSDKKSIGVDVSVKDKKILVKTAKQLERETSYRLVIRNAEAKDGSTFVDSKVYKFTMSGGPKVVGVSVGKSRVGLNQTITVTFDQTVSKDAGKFLAVKGGSAALSANGETATFALQSLPRCQPFTLQVKSGVKSKYGIKSTKPWSFASRTVCHTTASYGTSLQGRGLVAYHFGNSGPVTMFVGAIHGNESSSSGLMQAWINELEANPDRLKGKQIVVIPTINPDGVAAGTRTNSRSVNLNRNFPTSNWTRNIKDTDGTHKNGGGKKPLSEPESAALARITQQYSPRLLLSFHAIGSLVVGDAGSLSATKASQYASMVGYRNSTGSTSTFDYDITGSYEEWTWQNVGIPSMVIELGGYSYYSIEHHKAALWAML